MLSQSCEYALRAMAVLAVRPNAIIRKEELAREGKVPPGSLEKLMRKLRRAGLVKTGGGSYSLSRGAAEIAVVDVVEAIEPPGEIGVINEPKLILERVFGKTTIADLLQGAAETPPLCQVGRNQHA